jgi:hypothetical protein
MSNTVTIFIDNYTVFEYTLYCNSKKLQHIHSKRQYSIAVRVPKSSDVYQLVRVCKNSKKVKFILNKNGLITKVFDAHGVSAHVDTDKKYWMPMGTDVGTWAGITYPVQFCTPVWTPPRSKLILSD